jgi:Protein of unknown function (DUF1838)
MKISRRDVSGALLAVGAAAVAMPALAERQDLNGATDLGLLARLYRQMRFAGDAQVFFWWLQGRRYGLIDNVLTPFFDMHVGSVHRCIDQGAGKYRVMSAQIGYYTHLETGELLQTWLNPITGANVALSYASPRTNSADYGPAGPIEAPTANGSERRHLLGPVSVVGDSVWLREETHIVVPPAAAVAASGGGVAGPRDLRVHDMYTLQSPRTALRPTGALPSWVPALGQFNDFNSWSPRFQMGDRPGTSLSRCAGRKERRWQDMPEKFRALAAQVHPDWVRDPAAVLTS